MPWLNRGRFLAFSHVLTAGMSSSESALGSDFLRTWDHLRLTKTAAWMQVIIGLQENSDQSLVLIHPWSRRYARSGSPSAGAAGQGRDGLGHLVWKRMTAQCRWNGLLAMTCKDLQGAFFYHFGACLLGAGLMNISSMWRYTLTIWYLYTTNVRLSMYLYVFVYSNVSVEVPETEV